MVEKDMFSISTYINKHALLDVKTYLTSSYLPRSFIYSM